MRDHHAHVGDQVLVLLRERRRLQRREMIFQLHPFLAHGLRAVMLALALRQPFVGELQVRADAGIHRLEFIEGGVDLALLPRQFAC